MGVRRMSAMLTLGAAAVIFAVPGGAAAQQPSVTSLSFPDTPVGGTSAQLAVTVSSSCVVVDPGCAATDVMPTFWSGHTFGCPDVKGIYQSTCTKSTDYTQTNSCTTPLTAMSPPCTVQVTFTPQAAGARLATLNLGATRYSAPASVVYGGKVMLSGNGVASVKPKAKCKKKKKKGGKKRKCGKKKK